LPKYYFDAADDAAAGCLSLRLILRRFAAAIRLMPRAMPRYYLFYATFFAAHIADYADFRYGFCHC